MLREMRLSASGFMSYIGLGIFLLALGLALAGLIRVLPAFLLVSEPVDLSVFYEAARSLNAGRTPYVPGYLYPPFFAVLVRPLATLSLATASIIWLLLNLVAMVAAAALSARFVRASRGAFFVALVTITLIPASSSTLLLGQVNLLVTLLVVGTLVICLRSPLDSRSEFIAGSLLGLAIAIKVFPIRIAASFIIRRRFYAILAMLLTLFGTIVLGILFGGGVENTIYYFTDLLPKLISQSASNPENQSLYGVVARLFSSTTHRFAVLTDDNFVTVTLLPFINIPEAGKVIGQLLSGTILILSCLAILLGLKQTRGKLPFYSDFAVLILASLIASPISWDYYYTLLSVPYLVVSVSQLMSRQSIRVGLALSMLLVAVERYWRPLLVYTNSPWVTLFGFVGVTIMWAIVVYGVVQISSSRKESVQIQSP